MPSFPRTDQHNLRVQYADSSNLNARVRLHEQFSHNPHDFARWLFEHLDLPKSAIILEVGCGPGWLWRKNAQRIPQSWRIQLSDFSPGMAAEARQHLRAIDIAATSHVCDAQALPFPDQSFDAVIANHMLYHVPDLDKALGEFARVLKNSGTLYTATNGQRHLAEIDALMSAVEPGTYWRSREKLGFSLDEGETDLSKHFGAITAHDFPDEFRITQTAPLLEYIESSSPLTDEFRTALQKHIQSKIQENGHVYIGKQAGLFISRQPKA
jgi:SAM-dependent methyltransferase